MQTPYQSILYNQTPTNSIKSSFTHLLCLDHIIHFFPDNTTNTTIKYNKYNNLTPISEPLILLPGILLLM